MTKKIVSYSLIAASLITLAACNTVSGAGKDVASAGNAVSNTAEKSK